MEAFTSTGDFFPPSEMQKCVRILFFWASNQNIRMIYLNSICYDRNKFHFKIYPSRKHGILFLPDKKTKNGNYDFLSLNSNVFLQFWVYISKFTYFFLRILSYEKKSQNCEPLTQNSDLFFSQLWVYIPQFWLLFSELWDINSTLSYKVQFWKKICPQYSHFLTIASF